MTLRYLHEFKWSQGRLHLGIDTESLWALHTREILCARDIAKEHAQVGDTITDLGKGKLRLEQKEKCEPRKVKKSGEK